ncbi:hypothetical protein AFCDBAGC_3434 [Methylobacterium cerastii]|uniref:Uncharacterized protein n=2 Tax=Methylobacterium TaxID=407 RepID=A0ABQ4QKY6_9HYPH|nr:hypothetical protein FV234_00995 [Methylobacterium sp. WL8]GJD45560.1 hypothetical protein AFCDBAGC_3434 [Methylobacterium cerastii]
MRKTLISATALVLALSGAAFAQSATGNMNNPGSVKSNSEKAMEKGGTVRGDMPATTGTAPGAAGAATTMPAAREDGTRTVPGNAGANPVR